MNDWADRFLRTVGDVIVPICLLILVPLLGAFYLADRSYKRDSSDQQRLIILNQAQIKKIQVQQYEDQLSACERVNQLRERINANFARQKAIYSTAAEGLRERGTTPAAVLLAKVLMDGSASLHNIPLVACEEVVRKPDIGGAHR